jgi:hypothetical protein
MAAKRGSPKPTKKPKSNKRVVDKKTWREVAKKTRKRGMR